MTNMTNKKQKAASRLDSHVSHHAHFHGYKLAKFRYKLMQS
jgi:hypothetical protein